MAPTETLHEMPTLNTNPSVEEPLKLPGYGAPVNWMKKELYRWMPNYERGAYPNAVTSWAAENLTLREIGMMAVMNELTDKPDWERKVFDEEIAAKWKSEALEKNNFTEAMFDWVYLAGSPSEEMSDNPYSVWQNCVTKRKSSPRPVLSTSSTMKRQSLNPTLPSPQRWLQNSSMLSSHLKRFLRVARTGIQGRTKKFSISSTPPCTL